MDDKDIDAVFEAMPDGPRGFCISWGYRQFARDILAKANEPPPIRERDELEPYLVKLIAGLRHHQVEEAVHLLLDYIDTRAAHATTGGTT